MLRLLEVLRYEDKPITVLEAAGDTWVAATEVGRALGLHDNTVREMTRRNPDIFEPLTTTLDALWREGTTTSHGAKEDASTSARDRADTLFVNYGGVIAVLLKLDTSRVKDPDARARVVRFFQWALKDLKVAMLGRALPPGATPIAVPAWVESLSAAERSRLHRGLFHSAKGMPVSILVPLAASIGIVLDADAITAERAALLSPGSGGRSGAGGGATPPARPGASGTNPAGANLFSSDPDTLAHTYLEAIRGIVAEHAGRISGMEPGDGAGRLPVPLRGYIGGLANTHRDGRVLRVLALLPGAANELLTARLGPMHTGRTFAQAMQRAGAWVGDPTKPHVTAVVSYKRADGRKVCARHYCLLMERLWVEDGAGPVVGAETR
jgi:hypothetical protein